MKTVLAIASIFLFAPLLSLGLTGCDSKEVYDAKVRKYHKMYCAGAWPKNNRLPQPVDCNKKGSK